MRSQKCLEDNALREAAGNEFITNVNPTLKMPQDLPPIVHTVSQASVVVADPEQQAGKQPSNQDADTVSIDRNRLRWAMRSKSVGKQPAIAAQSSSFHQPK
jgi:hypothetical protein